MKNSIRSPPLRKDTLDDTWIITNIRHYTNKKCSAFAHNQLDWICCVML